MAKAHIHQGPDRGFECRHCIGFGTFIMLVAGAPRPQYKTVACLECNGTGWRIPRSIVMRHRNKTRRANG